MPRNRRNSKRRGSEYERKIASELSKVTGLEVKTARAISKDLDDKKIDLVDTEDKLPFYAQIKKTQSTPSYFDIAESCPLKDRPFCIFWNKVKPTESTFRSIGEVVIIPKEYFYKLISNGECKCNIPEQGQSKTD